MVERMCEEEDAEEEKSPCMDEISISATHQPQSVACTAELSGAGSREQGAGSRELVRSAAPPAYRPTALPLDRLAHHADGARCDSLLSTIMTSRPGRSLGGGRTLGSAKALSPAADPRPHHHHRNSSLLSPSESSVSLASQSSLSPASTADPESLTARVTLQHSDNVAAASASSRLVCPICNEEMVTLLQLNRHLDDLHQNLEEVEQDEIQTWFRTQMVKAKKFQPLAVLNQKLKGLDVFESNDSPFLPAAPQPPSAHVQPEYSRPLDPEELVMRTHWQRPSYSDPCSEPTCERRLGAANGCVNCRKCGRLFCEEHTMYQMKLSRSAQHEPVRGIWCRVCETCYKSRDGYNDHSGAERDHSTAFTAIRRKHVDKANLDISRLEKRLTKLTQLLADPPPPEQQSGAGSLIWPLSGAKAQQRALEQSIIAWEDDVSVVQCPFCQQEFTSYSFRRHHCRLCGRVVCGDPKTDCSTEVGLSVAARESFWGVFVRLVLIQASS